MTDETAKLGNRPQPHPISALRLTPSIFRATPPQQHYPASFAFDADTITAKMLGNRPQPSIFAPKLAPSHESLFVFKDVAYASLTTLL